MTGLVLVVDDIPANVKLLEAKLTAEYYDVITASDGHKALEMVAEHKPDLVLLDVMMPGMDGFETCKKMKEDNDVAHIPVVMVTALSDPSDRVAGLEAGADDFITKPINDTALFARVRSLIRIKVLIDELRLRDQSGEQMGIDGQPLSLTMDVSGAKVLVVDDDAVQSKRMVERLSPAYDVDLCEDPAEAVTIAKEKEYDLVCISTLLADMDGLRLATQMRAIEYIRNVPIIMMVDEDDQNLMLKGLELGINDYLIVPIDYNEMFARIKTQIRRKKYQDALKSNYQESVSMAVTDGLTRLYNRHYLDTHLGNQVKSAKDNNKPLALMIMDMDHFKHVNDTYGHDVGDEVLRQLSDVIVGVTRSSDLAARYGGEEFVVLMPETDMPNAQDVAERLRAKVESHDFKVDHEVGVLKKTVSIGVSYLEPSDTAETLMKRADTNLYTAKNSGRNQVISHNAEDAASAANDIETVPKPAQGIDLVTPEPNAVPAVPIGETVITPAESVPSRPMPQLNRSLVDDYAPAAASMPEIQAPKLQEVQPTLPPPEEPVKKSFGNFIDPDALKDRPALDLELTRNPFEATNKAGASGAPDDEPPGTF